MADKRAAKNQRKKKTFEQKYGMSRKDWAIYKKQDPQKAHELRIKNQ
jgi:hypothetical protein